MTASRIQVLPEHVVGRIAAGEVVERPASVIKELVENALDAGATRVEVTVEGGPYGRLSVADDGQGISADDLPLAVARHATSKLADADSLFAVPSLGFRGEGLAAVCAVATVEITSCPQGESTGHTTTVRQGKPDPVRPEARAAGTTVDVLDLEEALREPVGVMVRGIWLSPETIDERMGEIAERYQEFEVD